jgi:hypothetical protein
MVCLDDRRLNAQHNEAHIAISCIRNVQAGDEKGGWSNRKNAQIGPWIDKIDAIYDYHDNTVLPECRRRFPRSERYTSPEHPLFLKGTEPEHHFWDYIDWDMILLDMRHLIEKHNNDTLIVDHAKQTGQKTNVVRPKGHNPLAIVKVFHRAIAHVHSDLEALQKKAIALTCTRLLDRPKLHTVAKMVPQS